MPPTRSIDALLQRAQELGLQAHVHLGDLVEQQRAAVGLLELADAARDGAGEGALLVAEQLALEQLLGDRGAVDRDERAFARAASLAWTWRASTSLPVPLSPVISTLASEPAIWVASWTSETIEGSRNTKSRLSSRDRRQHRGDQLGVGGEGDVLLGAGADGHHRRAGVVVDAAGHHRHEEALGFERRDESRTSSATSIMMRSAPRPARSVRSAWSTALRMGHGGAAVHRDAGSLR